MNFVTLLGTAELISMAALIAFFWRYVMHHLPEQQVHKRKHKHRLQPATGLTAKFISRSISPKGLLMEKYRLNWTPSISGNAGGQHVSIKIADADATVQDVAPGVGTLDVDFPTDAPVTYFVTTESVKPGEAPVDSTPYSFTAVDGEVLQPATNLNASWQAHS